MRHGDEIDLSQAVLLPHGARAIKGRVRLVQPHVSVTSTYITFSTADWAYLGWNPRIHLYVIDGTDIALSSLSVGPENDKGRKVMHLKKQVSRRRIYPPPAIKNLLIRGKHDRHLKQYQKAPVIYVPDCLRSFTDNNAPDLRNRDD